MSIGPSSLGFIAVSSSGTPVQLSSTSLRVRKLRIQPRKNATTVNTGNVYIGTHSLNFSTNTGIFAVLSPEQTEAVYIDAPIGQDIDLSLWYVDADNSNDAVLVSYSA